MTAFLIIAGWLAGSVAGYLIVRADFRRTFGPSWSTGDRAMAMVFSAFGPLFLIAALIACRDWSRKAKW